MPRSITRKTLIPFGNTGPLASFAQFGSMAQGAPLKSKDPAVIQALGAWLAGWQNAITAGNAPYLEDMNAVHFLLSYMQAYLLQEGVAEWDAGTTYYIGSIVKAPGTFQMYGSLTDANLNNALPSLTNNTNWRYLMAQGSVASFAASGGLTTITPDASLANQFNVSLATNAIINGPSNPVDGQRVVFRFIQDSAGSRTVTFSSGSGNFEFSLDIPSVTLSTAASKVDYVGAIYNAAKTAWDIVSVVRGF